MSPDAGTNHSCQVAGHEQVLSVQGEEDDGHTGQDEVVEGDVHGCQATPVGGWDQTRDPQGGAALDLKKEDDTGVSQGYISSEHQKGQQEPQKDNPLLITSLSRVWSIAKYAGIPAASIPSMMASM